MTDDSHKATTQTSLKPVRFDNTDTKQDLPLVQLENEARTFYLEIKPSGSTTLYVSPDESGSYPAYLGGLTNRDGKLLIMNGIGNVQKAIEGLEQEGWTRVCRPMIS